jgi:hypothetical protein
MRSRRWWFGAVLLPDEGTPASHKSALISLDTPERSVLFRAWATAPPPASSTAPMNCRFDPSLDVPAEAYRALSGSR